MQVSTDAVRRHLLLVNFLTWPDGTVLFSELVWRQPIRATDAGSPARSPVSGTQTSRAATSPLVYRLRSSPCVLNRSSLIRLYAVRERWVLNRLCVPRS